MTGWGGRARGTDLPLPATKCEDLGYDRHRVIADGGRMLIFGSLEFAGTLRVVDPVPFLAALGAGFGAARGFGFGLMQIAPAAARPDL